MSRHPNQGKNQPFLQKLKESGIDLKMSNALRMEFLDAEDTAAALPNMPTYGRASIKIPYYNPFTEKPLPQKYARYRLLGDPIGVPSDKRAPKYLQPKGSSVYPYHAVFTRNSGKHVKWIEVSQDVSVPVILTEGEFKAICAILFGYMAIAFGGVDSFTEPGSGGKLLSFLAQIVWRNRTVYIIYDSDMSEKPQVYAAACRLAEILTAHGADVRICSLPATVGAKVGLDDYLMRPGMSVPIFESDVLESAESFRDLSQLAVLNEGLAYVRSTDHIYRRYPGKGWRAVNQQRFFKVGDYATQMVSIPGADGKSKKVSLISRWNLWAGRNTAQEAVYFPGASGLMEDGNLSTWPGWPCEFSPGDVAPFYALFNHVLKDCSAEVREYVLCWFAHTIKFPHIRNQVSIVVFSTMHGSGKSMLGDCLLRLHGENGRKIGQRDLTSEFCGWMADSTFVLCNEASGKNGDSRSLADKLKDITDARTVSVRKLYVDSYESPAYFNLYFTTNHPDAFYIEDTDRRYCIIPAPSEVLPKSIARRYVEWCDAGGLSHLGYHFQNDIDLSGFSPFAPPPKTSAHELMYSLSQSSFESFIDDALDAPDIFLAKYLIPASGSARREIFSVAEIREAYRTHTGEYVKDKTIRNVLEVKGIAKVCGGARIKVDKPTPYKGVYYAFAKPKKWASLDVQSADIKSHIAGGF